MKTLTRLITVDLRRGTTADILCKMLDDMLKHLPNADHIELTLVDMESGTEEKHPEWDACKR